MRKHLMAVAFLVLALGFSGCGLIPDFSGMPDMSRLDFKIPMPPLAPLATKAEVPVDPALFGTWTPNVKRDPAEADAAGVKLAAKGANEYQITPVGKNAGQQETAFLVQVGPHKILQLDNRELKFIPQWHFMWFKKLSQDETVLGLPYKSGDLVCGVLFFVDIPQDKTTSMTDTYREWIAKCDFSKQQPGEHVRAMPLIFWPVQEPKADKK